MTIEPGASAAAFSVRQSSSSLVGVDCDQPGVIRSDVSTGAWSNALIAVVALLSLAYYIKATAGELGHPSRFDDAYMFTRYAKHWLPGEGFSWISADGAGAGST